MKIISDPLVNELVKLLASKFFLEKEGFVIAGGFVTALYYFHLKSEGEKRTILRLMKLGQNDFADVKDFESRIGDIDYWVLKDSDASIFMKEWTDRDKDSKVKYIKPDNLNIIKSFKSVNLEFKKATRFSLSFRKTPKQRFKEQIIRLRTYEDVEDVFKDYDLSICQAGWYQGKLYISSNIESDFIFGTIKTVKPLFDYDNSFQRVWSVMRLFKYYKRYAFQPDKNAVNEAQQIFIEAIDFLNGNKEEQDASSLKAAIGPGFAFHPVQAVQQPKPIFGQVSWSAPLVEKEKDPYDSYRLRTVQEMRRYYYDVLGKMDLLFTLEHYNLTMAALLIDVPDGYNAHLKKYLESGGKEYYTVPEPEITDFFEF